jgi:hypothetical protein
VIAAVVHSDREHISDGGFLGITSITQPDGSQRAVEVHVFPDAMRGTGEGSYAWDLPGTGGSKMTNGTAAASKMTNGTMILLDGESSLTLQYKDAASGGSQAIIVPPGTPVVALEPGGAADLQVGASVFVIAHTNAQGALSADRILVGKNGVVPPM